MTKTARAIVPILIALMAAAVPALVLKQTASRPKTDRRELAADTNTSRYDPQMARACEQSCAFKIAYQESELATQPNTAVGALTHCVVSGVVFRVRKDGASSQAGGQTYHFCCGTCARLFHENPARFVSLKSRPA